MRTVLSLALLSGVIFGIARILPGIRINSYTTALIVAVVYSILNYLFFWLLAIISLPVMVLTLGLFTFVINAGLLWITDKLIEDFEIKDTLTLFIAAFLITLGRWLIRALLGG